MATKTATKTKQVEIIARVQFKADPKKVCYQVRSSNGKDTYWTCLFDGKATSCECPATTGRCYHMTQVQQIEAERDAEARLEVALTDLVAIDSWASLDESQRRIAFCNMFAPCTY